MRTQNTGPVATEKTPFERSLDNYPKLLIWGGVGTLVLAMLIRSVSPFIETTPLLTALCAVFGSFCVSIFVFAVAYQHIYRKNSSNFLFNEAIAKRQKELVEKESTKELMLLAKRIVQMSELLAEFVESKAVIEPKTYDVVLTSGVKYRFRPGPPLGGHPFPWVFLDVFDGNGTAILWDCMLPYGECPRKPQEFRDLAHSTIKSFSRRSLELEKCLATLSTDAPKVWSIADFVYFSTVIQATVGLGDILPNSTLARCVVAAQVLFGYVILLVALNMVLSVFH